MSQALSAPRGQSYGVLVTTRVDELVRLLDLAAGYRDGNPERAHITGLEHALRVGELAGHIDDEMAFVGLVHDLARPLSDVYHGEVMAEMVRDRVSQRAYTVLRTHGEYQAVHAFEECAEAHAAGEWHRTALRFAGCEIRSFAEPCAAIAYPDAIQLIRDRLS